MNGYDVLMILWGVVFVVAAVGFIAMMSLVFGSEERRQDSVASTWAMSDESIHPSVPAA